MKCTLTDPGIRLWALMPDPAPIDWEKDGDEWLHHLFAEFQERLGAAGWGAAGPHATRDFPALHLEYRLNDADMRSTLVLLLGRNELRVALAGDEAPNDVESELWLQALDGAFRRLGRVSHDYRWQAVIGPAAGALNGNHELQRAVTVGALTVQPGGVRLDEWTSGVNSPPSLQGGGRSATWPAVIEGRTTAYSWNVASRLASRTVHRLCVLFSIALESCWSFEPRPNAYKMILLS